MAEGRETRTLLAKIAVAEKMISQEVMDRVLDLMEAKDTQLQLGELLLQFGHITDAQFKQLMSLYQAARRPEAREDQKLFGEAVTSQGLATPDQVNACLREQAELAAQGIFKNLGELLVERRVLTEGQVRKLVEEQDQAIMVCPNCAEQYNVLRKWRGKARCPTDSVVLVIPSGETAVGVAATLGGREEPGSPIGMECGGCRIVELIAKGTMGMVYKAKHVGLNRYVAVKLLPSLSQDPEVVKRLLFEARAVAKIEHPNIVQVYDVGFQKGYFFIVMQLLRGQTLEERQSELQSMPVEFSLDVARDVAQGLGAAHGRGIIHRDLKPANIMVTEDGRARLTDFGLAQDTDNPEEKPGIIVGTPFYMSPEQWLGHKADERSDLYSLGIILYQMVTGRRPFDGTHVHELMNQHLKTPAVPPEKHDPRLPEGVAAIIKKLIAKAPRKRYANVGEFLADLKRLGAGQDPDALQEFGARVKCGFCEAFSPMSAKKCTICGESLHHAGGPIEIAMMEDEFKCPNCGAYNRHRARACVQCRKPFCTRCRKRVAVLRGVCHQCMSNLPPQ